MEKPAIMPKPSKNALASCKETRDKTSDHVNHITPEKSMILSSISPDNQNKLKKISSTVKSDLEKAYRNIQFEDKNVDQEGKLIKYDIREDEEQFEKCKLILETLVQAGYFRVTINGLSDFDKIIGGMTWCIQLCNVHIDVDLFYEDSLTIGQKISLTEKIVQVLRLMKCPFPLEPHQIQGMDCIHVYPAVKWLVNESVEFRKQIESYIKLYGVAQFNVENNIYQEEDYVTVIRSEKTKSLMHEMADKEKQRNDKDVRLDRLRQNVCLVDTEIEEINEQINKAKVSLEQCEKELLFVQDMKTKETVEELNKMETHNQKRLELLKEHFNLREMGNDLKKKIKQAKTKLRSKYEQETQESKMEKRIENLKQTLESEKDLEQHLKKEMVEMHQKIAILQRKVDEIPLQAELAQYQKRFFELHTQVFKMQSDMKKHLALHQQLQETKRELSKQFGLLDSLQDRHSVAYMNEGEQNSKRDFSARFESIVTNVGNNAATQSRQLNQLKDTKNNLKKKLRELQDLHEEYYELLSKLRKEIKCLDLASNATLAEDGQN